MNIFYGKKVLVTGGTGTVGREVVRKLLDTEARKIIVYSRSENRQAAMALKYPPVKFPTVEFMLGSVEDMGALERAISGCDIVIHLAAVKHINLAEKQPIHTTMVNILGVNNIIYLCQKHNVKKAVFISTDKAVNPTSVYGMTKRLGEQMFLEANGACEFYVVRFGNVFGSDGSVIQRWLDDAEKGLPIKVTDPNMTRFFFSASDAADLIFESMEDGHPECIYTAAMKSLRIGDIAEIIQTNGVEVIGNRGGEKVHECLATEDEKIRADRNIGSADRSAFSSETAERYSYDEIVEMLDEYKRSVG